MSQINRGPCLPLTYQFSMFETDKAEGYIGWRSGQPYNLTLRLIAIAIKA